MRRPVEEAKMDARRKPGSAVAGSRKLKASIFPVLALFVAGSLGGGPTRPSGSSAVDSRDSKWIGTWATAPQPSMPGRAAGFRNQTLRLIVRASAGGTRVRVRVTNTFGDQPLSIAGAHV